MTPNSTASTLAQLGARLKQARLDAGLVQEDVARRTGTTTRSLVRWESGDVEAGVEEIKKLADLYGVSIDWLTGRTDIQGVIRSGSMIIDPNSAAQLRKALKDAKSLRDIPREFLRPPGFTYVTTVPKRAQIVNEEEAKAIDLDTQILLQKISGRKL